MTQEEEENDFIPNAYSPKETKLIAYAIFEAIIIDNDDFIKNEFGSFLLEPICAAGLNVKYFSKCKKTTDAIIDSLISIKKGERCKFSKTASDIKHSRDYCYLIRQKFEDRSLAISPVKVGFTNDIQRRLKDFQIGCPVELEIYDYIYSPFAWYLERYFHDKYEHCNIRGEWFELEVYSEMFERAFSLLKNTLHDKLKY